MLEKIIFTISGMVTIALVWVAIKNVKIKAFAKKIKDATADGKITSEEGIDLLLDFIGLFRKE